MMKPEHAKEHVLAKLWEYARGRKSDVARGAETPQLAALLVQKYGYGLCDAFAVIYGPASSPTYRDVDAAVAEIDPDWRNTQDKRWAARPAGISMS